MREEIYKQTQQEREKYWWFLGRRKIINTILKRYLNNAKHKLKILDVGCGSATAFSSLKSFGSLYGVDKSDIAVKFCRKLDYVEVKKADATKLPYLKSTFDLVVALDLLEHVENDIQALKEFNRVLKNYGYLMITVPAMPFLWNEKDQKISHFRRYLKGELKAKIQSAGFEVKRISYFSFFLFPFYLLWHFNVRIQKIIDKNYRIKSGSVIRIPSWLNIIFTILFSAESFLLLYLFL